MRPVLRNTQQGKHLAGKQAPPLIGVPNNRILSRSMLISQLMGDNVRGSQSGRPRRGVADGAGPSGKVAAALKVNNSAVIRDLMDQLRGISVDDDDVCAGFSISVQLG